MQMGTGKTFTTIVLAGMRRAKAQIRQVLVICPTSIKPVWSWEQSMSPVATQHHVVVSGAKGVRETEAFIALETDDLKYLIVGVEALSSKAGKLAQAFAKAQTTMLVVDESSKIKNPKAQRSRVCAKIALGCDYATILTGTPVTQGLEDLYSQFHTLNPDIIGIKTFFMFKLRHCIMGGFNAKKIVGYKNVPELMTKIAPYIYQVTKAECLDLPDKVYTGLTVSLTPEQGEMINSLSDFFEAECDGEVLTISTAFERLTRFQQIIGGNFPFNDGDVYGTKPITGANPKLDAMCSHLDTQEKGVKVIIWARYRAEIGQIQAKLAQTYGASSIVEYHGGIGEKQRAENIKAFQSDNAVLFFVANQQSAGMGITLTKATLVYYYSNSFSLEDRIQSEDRCHRKGQTNKVTYVDIWCDHPADKLLKTSLTKKQKLADVVANEIKSRRKI